MPTSRINDIKYKTKGEFLRLDDFSKSQNIRDYSPLEITEMFHGVYRYSNMLLTDGDYFINMDNVVRTKYILEYNLFSLIRLHSSDQY